MNKDFISKSKEINKYLKILKRVADFEPKFKRKYKSEMNYAKKHNKYFKKGGDIPRYIPPHRRINKTKTYLPPQKLRQMKRNEKKHIKNVRKQSNFNLNTYTNNGNSKLDEEINEYILKSKSLKGIVYDRNEQTFVIPTTFAKFMKDEKNPIYILDEDKYYEDIFSVGRKEKALELRKRNIDNELKGINLNDILDELKTNTQFVLLFEDNDFLENISINVLGNINGKNAIDIYKIINSLPFINQDIEKELKKLKQYINYIYVYENNIIDNLGIVNTLYPESNFIHTRGCACNLKIPEKDFISPLFGHLNEKQLVVKTDKFNCCLKYFDVLDMYNESIVFDKLTIIVNMEKFLIESINIFFARINEDDLYFDLVRKRLIQEYALEAPEGLREIKKVKFKLPINNKPGQYIRTYTYGTLDNNNNFTMYDKFWRKLHEGSIFTTEERYSDYSLLIKRIYNLFIYRVFLNGEKKSYFLLSKYSIKQISNYYKMIANKDIYINDEVYEILDVIGGNRNNSIETTVNYRLINSGLNFEMRILEFFNPYKEFNFKKDLPYILYSTEKSGKQKSELLEIRDKMKTIYEGQYNELMSSISNINRSPGKIIKDTGEIINKIIYDLRNYDYKLKNKLEKANADKMAIIKYGPGGSGKGSKLKPILKKLGFYKDNYLDLNIDDIIEKQSYFIEESQKIYNKYMKNKFNKINRNNFNELKYNKINIDNNKINYYNQQIYLCIRNYFYEKDKTISYNLNNSIKIAVNNNKNFIFETTGSYFGLPYWLFEEEIYDKIKNYNLIVLFPVINTAFETFKRTLFRAKNSGNKKLGQRFEPYYQEKKEKYNQSYFYFFNNLLINDNYIKYFNFLCMINNSFITNNNKTNNLYIQKGILNNKNINIIKKIDKIEKVYELEINEIHDILSRKNTIIVINKKDKDIIMIIFKCFFGKNFDNIKISINTLALNLLNFNKIYFI